MSLTVNQEPQAYTPVYNEMTFRLDSDETGQSGFRFKVEVSIYDSLGSPALVYTGYFQPRPNTTELIFDAHRIIENYLRQTLINDFVEEVYGFIPHNDIDSVVYDVEVTEQYGSPITDYASETFTLSAFNSSLKYQNFVSWNYENYIPALNDATKKFLTNSPSTQTIGSSESAQLSFLISQGVDFPVDEGEIRVYEQDGTLQQTLTVDFDELGTNHGLHSILVGTKDLEDTIFTSGSKPVFDTDSSYYTFQLVDENGEYSSELKTFTIKDDCQPPMRVHFLNRLAGIDSFTFGLKHKKGLQIEREEVNRQGYLYSTEINNLQKENGLIQASITARDTIILNSDWLTDEYATWLEELITSPEIFLEMDGVYHSVIPTNQNNYEFKTQNQDGTFNLSIEFKFAYSSQSQRA